MDQFTKILVAVDVTVELSGAADGQGREVLAQAAAVRGLLSLQERPGQVTVVTVLPADQGSEPAVAAAARQRLVEGFVPLLDADDVQLAVRFGTPFLEVIREVLRGGHDLLVVGAHGSAGEQGEIVNHIATQLIRKCPCPVWVAPREGWPPEQGAILAAVGLQHGLSPLVVRLAASIARLSGCEWHVLHVPEYPLEGGMRLRGAEAEEVQAYENECREMAWKELHRLTDELAAETGLQPKLWMAEGRPSEQIADAEQKLDARLIVMGTIGRGGLAGMIIGNTAERTLLKVKSSILAVKPDDFVCPVTL